MGGADKLLREIMNGVVNMLFTDETIYCTALMLITVCVGFIIAHVVFKSFK